MLHEPSNVIRFGSILNLSQELDRLRLVARLRWVLIRVDEFHRDVDNEPVRLNQTMSGNSTT